MFRGKRIVFVGDSLGRAQWESFVCLLMTGVDDKKSVYEVNGHKITKTIRFLGVRFSSFNLNVDFYRSVFLVQHGSVPRHSPMWLQPWWWLQPWPGSLGPPRASPCGLHHLCTQLPFLSPSRPHSNSLSLSLSTYILVRRHQDKPTHVLEARACCQGIRRQVKRR
jgi:hypothetical protein